MLLTVPLVSGPPGPSIPGINGPPGPVVSAIHGPPWTQMVPFQ